MAQQWCGLGAIYLEKEIINKQINIANINLDSLLDLSAKLTESKDINYILKTLSLAMMGKFLLSKYAIYYFDKDEFKHIKSNINLNIINLNTLELSSQKAIITVENNYINSLGINYSFPIYNKNKVIALILFGNKYNNSDFTDLEIKYIDVLSKIGEMALNNAIIHTELKSEKNIIDQKNHILETLLELSKDLSGLNSQEEIIRVLGLNLMGQIGVSKFSLYLLVDNNYINLINRFNLNIPDELINSLFTLKKITNTKQTNNNTYLIHNKIELIFPMISEGKTSGVLLIGEKINKEDYCKDDINFISSISYLSVKSLDNSRLITELIEKKKYEKELDIAKNIQINLLPKQAPIINDYQIDGFSYPSTSVGGDYYDFINIGDNKILFIIADVSGKGMPAALIMASLQAALHIISQDNYSLIQLLNKINKLLFDNTSSDKYVTAFIAILNTKENTFEYINAGHNPPLYLSNNKIKLLDKGGLILGLIDEYINYESRKIHLKKDAIILAYTDGVTESGINDDNEYGINKLGKFLEKHSQLPINQLLNKLYNEIKIHGKNEDSYDDISAFALKLIN